MEAMGWGNLAGTRRKYKNPRGQLKLESMANHRLSSGKRVQP